MTKLGYGVFEDFKRAMTLLLRGEHDALGRLQALLKDLASGRRRFADMGEIEWAEAARRDPLALCLSRSSSMRAFERRATRKVSASNGGALPTISVFCADLIAPLAEPGAAGHQHLEDSTNGSLRIMVLAREHRQDCG